MSNEKTATATKTKGPSVTAKGVMPPDKLARWKTSNLSFPTEKPAWFRRRKIKEDTQFWKTMRLLSKPGVPYARLPANLRGAIADLSEPLTRSDMGARRSAQGGEGGEIVTVAPAIAS